MAKQVQILPNIKETIKNWPNSLFFVPKWRNFVKSCHTRHRMECTIIKKYLLFRTAIMLLDAVKLIGKLKLLSKKRFRDFLK